MPSDFMLDKRIRMRIKLKNAEIQEYVNAPASEFPKYTTQLMNIANQNSQACTAIGMLLSSEIVLYHNLVSLEGGPNFRWQYTSLNQKFQWKI